MEDKLKPVWSTEIDEYMEERYGIDISRIFAEVICDERQKANREDAKNSSNSASRCVICGRTIGDGFPACAECRNSNTFNNL